MTSGRKGWMPISERPPTAEEGGGCAPVYVWHAYMGVMLAHADALENPFYVYWMPMDADASRWIDAAQRAPTEADADAHQCVLAMDCFGDIRVIGWRQFTPRSKWKRWQPLPQPPPDGREIRQRV